MPLDLVVKDNIKDVARQLNDLQKKQLPYATAAAMTATIKDCQGALTREAQTVFNNKKVWYKQQQPTGIKVVTADKKLWPALVATVYSKAYFLSLQTDGGIKTPFKSKSLLIPTANTPKTLANALGPEKVLAQKNTFSNKRGIFKKTGGKKNPVVKKIFTRAYSAVVPKRYFFDEVAQREAKKKFPNNFYQRLSIALRTMR
jgi:hypothetical protein